MPLQGEARDNPYYAAQRFAEFLGASTTRNHELALIDPRSVVVLSQWHWTLNPRRQTALEHWVASGGRLVVEGALVGGEREFEDWSGVVRRRHEFDEADRFLEMQELMAALDGCHEFFEEPHDAAIANPGGTERQLCNVDLFSYLETTRPLAWGLTDKADLQVARVSVGRGSVTVINGIPFQYRNVLAGDQAWLFVASTQLHRGDRVQFVSEANYPSILALTWQNGASIVVTLLAVIAAALWRASVRFGPMIGATESARRSLAEQIRGTAAFVLRRGGGPALHAAAVRALDEAARRQAPGYARMTRDERVAVVARLTRRDASQLRAAVSTAAARPNHLPTRVALLEAVRRQLLEEQQEHSYETR
jgi:hypothetical protein